MTEEFVDEDVLSEEYAGIVARRIEELEARRVELKSELERKLNDAMQPIDASIKELKYIMGVIRSGQNGDRSPSYILSKRTRGKEAPDPVTPDSLPSPVRVFAPASRGGAGSPGSIPAPQLSSSGVKPAPEVVLSPKTQTPVSSNVAQLKMTIGSRQ